VVDKYIEFEFILVFIDLLLHDIAAYRHVIYNLLDEKYLKQQLFKIVYISILFESCMVSYFKKLDFKSLHDDGTSFILIFLFSFFEYFFIFFILFLLNKGRDFQKVLIGYLFSHLFQLGYIFIVIWNFPFYFSYLLKILSITSGVVSLTTTLWRENDISTTLWREKKEKEKYKKYFLFILISNLILYFIKY
jgi:lipid intermediate transporter